MVWKKGNLPVTDSRSSEERKEEDQYGCCEQGQVCQASQTLGEPPYLAEGAKGGEPELISPSQPHQGTKFSGGKAPIGIRQS